MTKEILEMMTKLIVIDSDKRAEDKMNLILSKLDSICNTSSTNNSEEHLMIDEVCKLTRKSRVTIWQWNKKGILRPIGNSGKNPLYLKSDVLDFLYKNPKSV